MIDKSDAIVMRIFPFSRTSHIVSWLAEDGSQIVTSVKGATRSKSAFLGQYDLFYTCELLYYTHASNGVHIARECTPLVCREKLRTNWRAEQCASWFTALAYTLASNNTADPALYRLLAETLDFVSASDYAPPPIVFARFEAKILDLAGISPNFSSCPLGHETPDADPFRFNLASGSRFCPDHSLSDYGDPMISVSTRTVDLYNEVVHSTSLGPQSTVAKIHGPAVFALLRFLGLFMRYHLESVPIDGRAIALKALAGPSDLLVNGRPEQV